MTAIHVLVVAGCSLLLLMVMSTLMVRAIQRERRAMDRRRAEWIAGGRIPEQAPNFYSGNGGGG